MARSEVSPLVRQNVENENLVEHMLAAEAVTARQVRRLDGERDRGDIR